MLVATAALRAGRPRGASTVIGRLLEAKIAAGRVRFTVVLVPRARQALRRLGRLALTVKIALTPPASAKIARTLKVALLK